MCVFLLWVRVAHMCVGTVASVAQGTSWGAAITQAFCPDLCCVSPFYYLWYVACVGEAPGVDKKSCAARA